jgi:hypothetical protein
MEDFGVCLANRSVECILCQQYFTRVSGDLILTEDLICDDCLIELKSLKEGEFRKQVSERLAKNLSHPSQEFENEVARIIQQFGQREIGSDAHGRASSR